MVFYSKEAFCTDYALMTNIIIRLAITTNKPVKYESDLRH